MYISEPVKPMPTVLSTRLQKEMSELEIVATYNLLFNASLMVAEGLGYAIGPDKIINTSGNSNLCFRPLTPKRESKLCMTLIIIKLGRHRSHT